MRDEIEDALAEQHAEDMFDVRVARTRLGKLTVAELRALHVHYYVDPVTARQLNKEGLIDDLFEPIMEEER